VVDKNPVKSARLNSPGKIQSTSSCLASTRHPFGRMTNAGIAMLHKPAKSEIAAFRIAKMIG
jgi:hypothetical protein